MSRKVGCTFKVFEKKIKQEEENFLFYFYEEKIIFLDGKLEISITFCINHNNAQINPRIYPFSAC